MAPERFRGQCDARSDVYGLGLTHYELLARRPAFDQADRGELIKQVTEAEPPPLRKLDRTIPRDLATIVHKAIEHEPSHRYRTADDLAEDLRRFIEDRPIAARRITATEQVWRWCRRNPLAAGLSASLVTTLVAGLVVVSVLFLRLRAEAEGANRRLYGVRMNLVQRFWEDWDPDGFHQTLAEQLPENQRGFDRRGWEWHYWQRKVGSSHTTLQGHTGPVSGVAFSPDGSRLASASYDNTVKVWDAREVTPELLVRDEARGLILLLVNRLATEADLRDRVARDRTRSPAVRAAALDMVSSFWAARTRRRAEAIVGPLFARLFLRDDVLAAIQAQPAAEPEIRAACLELARTWTESGEECNNAGWDLVREPGRPDAIYQRGLRLAKAACRLEPDNGFWLKTLGVAQYRLGLVAEALATLTRSNTLNEEKQPVDLAFLAMAHQRLGQPAVARAMLDRLRDVMRQRGSLAASQVAEDLAFLAEAEAVVLYDPIIPADPFAP